MERAEPVSVDAFAIELLAEECKISNWGLLKAQFEASKERETGIIIGMITSTRQVLDAFFDSDIPSILLPSLYMTFFLSFIPDNSCINYD